MPVVCLLSVIMVRPSTAVAPVSRPVVWSQSNEVPMTSSGIPNTAEITAGANPGVSGSQFPGMFYNSLYPNFLFHVMSNRLYALQVAHPFQKTIMTTYLNWLKYPKSPAVV